MFPKFSLKKNKQIFYKIDKFIYNIFKQDMNQMKLLKNQIEPEIKKMSPIELKNKRTKWIKKNVKSQKSILTKLYLYDDITISNIRDPKKKLIGTVEYTGYNYDNKTLTKSPRGIANGTWINNGTNKCVASLVNIYKTKLTVNDVIIHSIRYGTASKCPTSLDKDYIRNTIQKLADGHRVINFSLLSHCSGSCHLGSDIIAHGSLEKANETLIYEPIIIKNEQEINTKDFITIFIPLSVKKEYPNIHINRTSDINKKNSETCSKTKCSSKIQNLISLYNPNKTFESIVKMFIYYFLFLKNHSYIAVKCKSGKDRSGLFHNIFLSTLTKMALMDFSGKHTIDEIYDDIIEDVRKWFKEFLKIGMIISYYSTGLVGLKIKHSAIIKELKQILESDFDNYVGISKYINDV
jgi:hypothetical protein